MIAPPEPDQIERVILRTAREFDPAQRILVVGDTTGTLTAAALANPDARVWPRVSIASPSAPASAGSRC
ncbi:hypothetical protein [Corynebacterium doosanense]|uniref:hypothetical protein n=1 Tax=Corynebacterium doosanense TaxID=1121358 RepID=UPI00056FC632|nr:hypothetical protein [Corynebacterium doosanense]